MQRRNRARVRVQSHESARAITREYEGLRVKLLASEVVTTYRFISLVIACSGEYTIYACSKAKCFSIYKVFVK